jgi:two-component system sensor histidine kinase GlrK
VQNLAEQSERAVREAAVATRASREMTETLTGMERALRQYLVLRERSLLDDYRRLRGELRAGDAGICPAAARRDQPRRPTGHARAQRGLLDRLGEGAAVSPEELLAIARQAQTVLSTSSHLIDVEVEHLRTTALDARSTLMWQLLAAIPVTLGIALWFRAIISSQLKQFDRAIRTIGRADYTDGVTVTGPQDLAYLGRRLDWLRRRLAELEEQKNRFLRHVSHDLKTPLTAIREGAQLLGEGVPGPLSEQQKTIIDIIDQNSRRLQQLIEELINYQQAGFAAGSIDPQPVALDVVCTQVLRTHRLVAAARAIRFERKLAPVLVEGDADKLRVVVDNLITNAIKFSPREGVIHVGLDDARGKGGPRCHRRRSRRCRGRARARLRAVFPRHKGATRHRQGQRPRSGHCQGVCPCPPWQNRDRRGGQGRSFPRRAAAQLGKEGLM